MSRLLILTVGIGVYAIAASGCPGSLIPGSEMYRGFTPNEQEHFARAKRDVFPSDVRMDIARYRAEKVAWPGYISDAKWIEKEGKYYTRFVIEHHYYDWIIDHSIQKEKMFFSPRGEGVFAALCPSRAEQEAIIDTTLGNVMIIYGSPDRTEDGMLYLTCDYATYIDREWVRTDVFDYGRPEEPVRLLNVPGPGAGTALRRYAPENAPCLRSCESDHKSEVRGVGH